MDTTRKPNRKPDRWDRDPVFGGRFGFPATPPRLGPERYKELVAEAKAARCRERATTPPRKPFGCNTQPPERT